jgi:hypothetical protein
VPVDRTQLGRTHETVAYLVGRRVGVTDNLSGTLGDEIGIVAADDVETPLPHIILTRRFDLK